MQFIDIKEVTQMTGVKKTFIYGKMKEGKFPQSVHMGKSTLWVKDEILQFMQNLMDERQPAKQQEKSF